MYIFYPQLTLPKTHKLPSKSPINLVWLKRDLRLQDHEALFNAEKAPEDYLIIYILEPSALAYPDCSLRHLQFIYHSIQEMNQQLKPFNREVLLFHAEAIEALTYLSKTFHIKTIYSYQESGIQATWNRDRIVAKFLDSNNINWNEYQNNGVLRGIKNRVNWNKTWYDHVNQPLVQNKYTKAAFAFNEHDFQLQAPLKTQLQQYPESFQYPGEKTAWKYLYSFCEERGKDYNRFISKPEQSRKSCGRISPYLAWGNLSVRQTYQFVKQHHNYKPFSKAFNGLLTRLKWRCHFIQKFENECKPF